MPVLPLRSLFFCLALVAGCGGGSGGSTQPAPVATPPPPIAIDMDQTLDVFIADNSNVPSIAMMVVKDGEVVYQHTAGFADQGRTRAPTYRTLYPMSSVGKLIISIAVMQQVELGLVEIEQDIGDYLPFPVRNPNFPDTVTTVEMLMRHSTGLSNPAFGETTDELFTAFDSSAILQLHPLIEDVLTPGSARYRETVWQGVAPGAVHKNSNLGMLLLGYLVEQVSGLHFTTYAQVNIFDPLGMGGTSHYFPDLDPSEVVALFDDNGASVVPVASYFYPVFGLYTSTGDWARFLAAILNGGELDGIRILQTASVDRLLATVTPANNQLAYNSNIGLIWREAAANPGWIGHTGAGTQMTHVTELNRATGVGYAVFTNEGRIDSQIGPGGTLNTIVHQWLQEQGF